MYVQYVYVLVYAFLLAKQSLSGGHSFISQSKWRTVSEAGVTPQDKFQHICQVIGMCFVCRSIKFAYIPFN